MCGDTGALINPGPGTEYRQTPSKTHNTHKTHTNTQNNDCNINEKNDRDLYKKFENLLKNEIYTEREKVKIKENFIENEIDWVNEIKCDKRKTRTYTRIKNCRKNNILENWRKIELEKNKELQNNKERNTTNKDTNEWITVRNNLKQNKVSKIENKIETKNQFEKLNEMETRHFNIEIRELSEKQCNGSNESNYNKNKDPEIDQCNLIMKNVKLIINSDKEDLDKILELRNEKSKLIRKIMNIEWEKTKKSTTYGIIKNTIKKLNEIEKTKTEEYKKQIDNENETRAKQNNEKINWKIGLHNINGLMCNEENINENKLKKIQRTEMYMKTNDILLMNINETWLKEDDDQESIEGYKSFRGDRKILINKGEKVNKGDDENDELIKKCKGGVLTYVNNTIEAEKIYDNSIGGCEILIIRIEEINMVNVNIYRPPRTRKTDFKKILENMNGELIKIIEEKKGKEPMICISGDFNFPFVDWELEEEIESEIENKNKKKSNCNDGEKQQYEMLGEICDEYQMIQIVNKKTRGNNILDLVYTSDSKVMNYAEVEEVDYSDHKRISVETTIKTSKDSNSNKKEKEYEIKESKFRELNVRDKEVNWEQIGDEIELVEWNKMFSKLELDEMLDNFDEILYETCKSGIKRKKCKGKTSIPKEIRKLMGKIRKLRRKEKTNGNRERAKEIAQVEIEIQNEIEKAQERQEQIAIENIIKNPKYLYAIINNSNKKNRINMIGPLEKENKIIDKGEQIAETLIDEYSSEFTDQEIKYNERGEEINNKTETKKLFINEIEGELVDIEITDDDIEKAINSIDENSSAGPDGVPAFIIKKLKKQIIKPLKLMLRKSIDEGIIPKTLKSANITPIHKGGSRKVPGNYRPVSLTSHIMKIFEKVIKKKIVEYLTKEQRFNKNQFGFIEGRSTITQLLKHYNDIHEAIKEKRRMDTVYLDFAKAFDKVDHVILMQKVKKHGIGGKIGIWLTEFLWDREFTVIANGKMSKSRTVKSGVPQGTVLAALLFVIMISDIDKDIIDSLVRSFADDTRVNKIIRKRIDITKMERDLKIIYKWAEDNKMKFNENKFEQMVHGVSPDIEIINYKNSKGENIEIKEEVKDLGVLVSSNFKFKGHIEKIVKKAKIRCKQILSVIKTRKKIPMMRLYNAYIKSILEYGNLIWSPSEKGLIERVETIQRNYTSKIEELKDFNYHERLKRGGMYSLQRRRERFEAMWAWMLANEKIENILELKFKEKERNTKEGKVLEDTLIRPWRGGGIERLPRKSQTIIKTSTRQRLIKTFNGLPKEIREIDKEKSINHFKEKLDKWLEEEVPDQPIMNGLQTAAESNSISDQHKSWKGQWRK